MPTERSGLKSQKHFKKLKKLKSHEAKKINTWVWILAGIILVALFTSIFCGIFYIYNVK
jgi:quinol-cytochrome oxidoreductase complex cytochrome b subunit